ncbi:MAG: flavin reductase family protein, partial [Oscillospiraceae bacterium]
IINTVPPMTYISVRPERFSYNFIKNSGEFVINLPTTSLVRSVDFCGCTSGKDTDKWTRCNITPQQASIVNAPLLAQSPVNLECKVKSITELGSHHMFIADIVAVNVEGEFLEPNGRLMVEKLDLICYGHGTYFPMGRPMGTFGYSVRKKPVGKKYKGRKK